MKQCVIFGNPVQHSKSPQIHHQFAQENGIELCYQLACTPLNNLKEMLDKWMDKKIIGANVTIPFKEEMVQYCDFLTPEAQRAKAVNTIRIREGKIEGHNTDGVGLLADIEKNKNYPIKGKRILLLGAGGASRGILKPLLEADPKQVTITNRTFSRAEELVNEFNEYDNIRAEIWSDINQPYDLILNATSASLKGVFPELNRDVITKETVGYDLMYSDHPTVFMKYLLANGGKASYDGLGMLVEQAVLGFEYWFGIKPNTEIIYKKLRSINQD